MIIYVEESNNDIFATVSNESGTILGYDDLSGMAPNSKRRFVNYSGGG